MEERSVEAVHLAQPMPWDEALDPTGRSVNNHVSLVLLVWLDLT